MNRVEELIERLCPDGVEYKKLGECCILEKGSTPIQKAISGKYPLVVTTTQRKSSNTYQFEKPSVCIPLISSRGHGVASLNQVYYQDGKFALGNILCCVTPLNDSYLSAKYLYYYINLKKNVLIVSLMRGGANVSLTVNSLRKVIVPIPPLEVQNEIVRILDSFTQLVAELEAELEARKKQYGYYLKSLVTYDKHSVPWKKLGDIAEIGTGSSNSNEGLTEGLYPFYVRSQTPLRKNDYEFDEVAIITAGDGVGVGKVLHYVEGKYALHQRAYRIHPIDKHVHPKYVYYYMKGTFLDYIKKSCFHSSVTSIRRPMMNNYLIPLPPLEEQTRIVSILDQFDKLCNDLTEGLPAEIKARKKQYEHYREKLLTFKKKECSA